MALCVLLLLSTLTPAFAVEEKELRLQEITQTVKTQLGIDTNLYTKFDGNLDEGLLENSWSLNWWNEEGFSLRVTASETGVITSYYRSDMTVRNPYDSFFGPQLPKDTGAKASAEAFLAQVLAPHESVDLSAAAETATYFSGTILLNGVESPFIFRLSVRGSDAAVLSYSRTSARNYTAEVPSATPSASAADAAKKLATTNTFKLQYVLPEGETMAVLRYLPQAKDEFYVNAQTGKLINLTELARGIRSGESWSEDDATVTDEEAPLGEVPENGLTEAEEEGAQQYQGVLDGEALLAKVREAYPQLMLEDFVLANARFTVTNREEGEVTAYLLATKADGERSYYRYSLTVDAKTGALHSFSSSWPYTAPTVNKSAAEAEALARAFITAYAPQSQNVKLVLQTDLAQEITKSNTCYRFTYMQEVNGYLYAGNRYDVSIDPTTGAVRGFTPNFDYSITFDSAENLIDEATANAAYYAGFETQLRYVAVPFFLDPNEPEYEPLIERGQNYLYRLTLGYQDTSKGQYISGVDAKSGALITYTYQAQESALQYSDVSNHWVRTAAQALAAQNIGYAGGTLQPEKALTQLDMLALLSSANGGGTTDLTDEAAVNRLYQNAYYNGILTYGEREEGKVLTRAEMIKMLLDISGYGRVAQLKGIFTCTFTDRDEIPSEYLGYAAIAQAIGVVKGDSYGAFAPNRPATRAEAISVLYNFMHR